MAFLEAALAILGWSGGALAVIAGGRRAQALGLLVAGLSAAAALALVPGRLGAVPLLLLATAAVVIERVWRSPPEWDWVPAASAPVISLVVVMGGLAAWIGVTLMSGPGSAATRAIGLSLLGIGAARLVAAPNQARAIPAGEVTVLALYVLATLGAGGRGTLAVALPSLVLALVALGALALAALGEPKVRTTRRQATLAAAGVAAILVSPNLLALALMVLFVAVADLVLGGDDDLRRLRPMAAGAALLALSALTAVAAGPESLQRLSGLTAAVGMTAVAGLVPFAATFKAGDRRSVLTWTAVFGPVVAFTALFRMQSLLPPAAASALGATLVALGVANLAWGLAGTRLENGSDAWRHSFGADWGLALIGLGLLSRAGAGAAFLVLLAMIAGRLPAALWGRAAREEPVEESQPELRRPARLAGLWVSVLAGLAPFAGFPGRVLLLGVTTSAAWPLALIVAAGLVLWLPTAARLAATLARPRRRLVAAQVAALALNAAVGIFPLVLLRPLGLA